MNKRPELNSSIDIEDFKNYYYLKDELVDFCRKNELQTSGSKLEIIERIEKFLKTGERIFEKKQYKKKTNLEELILDSLIEENFVCSEKHREFYKKHIGKSFSFNVLFQKWLKNNSGKTYQDSIKAYYEIVENKKNNKTSIDKQFEYNTYIRDFFYENKDKKLEDAIKCWKFKKSKKGNNKYEKEDLKVL